MTATAVAAVATLFVIFRCEDKKTIFQVIIFALSELLRRISGIFVHCNLLFRRIFFVFVGNRQTRRAKLGGKNCRLPICMSNKDERKSKMISMRVTDKQYAFLTEMARRIKAETGFKITRASIILKLMEYGLPYLERDFPAPTDKEKKSA